jgi:LemA protein
MTGSIIVALAVVLLIAGIWIYNRLVRQRNRVSEAWAGIDVQLQRRHELVPNLVETVRGYSRHESGVLEKVTRLRGNNPGPSTELAEGESSLSRSIARLFALAEDYPDLKASENFAQLHTSLIEVEDQLQYARRYYNGTVRDNNTMVESFPANLVAGWFRFHAAEFFEIELASHREAPDVRV